MIRNILFLVLIFLNISTIANTYDAELIAQRTTIEVNKNKLTKELYYEIKINNRAGEKFTKITIPYSKLIKVSNIEAYIKDEKGKTVKKIRKSDIVDRSYISDFSLYEDDFIKEFTLKHNSYPYTIVYSYEVTQNEFLSIVHWMPVIDEKIPTLSAQLQVSVPMGYKISFKNQLVENPKIDTSENQLEYKWKAQYKNIVKEETYSPPISCVLPLVKIVPVEFKYEKKGSFENWNTYGCWESSLLEGLNELPETEKEKINHLIKGVDDEKEKIKKIYHYLQDATRYINVTIETGGLKPYPASYVAQKKYGDCKALSNYFKSVLSYVNIQSYYTNVYAGTPIMKIDKSFPSQQANHVILYIPLEEEDIWLDCTSNAAFDYLGTFTQNRYAFIVDGDKSQFVKTPSLNPEDVLNSRKIEIHYESENATVKFTNNYKGRNYENILYLLQNHNKSEISEIMRNYLVEDGFQLIDYEIYNPNRDSTQIKLSYKTTSQNIYKHYGNDLLISNIPFLLPDFEKPEERKQSVQIDYPICKIDTLVYKIPENYHLYEMPKPYFIENKYGEYAFNVYQTANTFTVIKKILINKGCYPVSDYNFFYDFYKFVSATEAKIHLSFYK